ncbi:MAG TPA: nucleotidyltransferase family protein [Longimicrobiaceae bacterium]|nr:nucleotidyltransferase family protein [Longimicrobiaceae bacterium]
MIAGIVLAAGRSRRMGAPKPLLDLGGESFLSHVTGSLRGGGCTEIVVVVGAQEEAPARRIASAAREVGARVVVNPLAEAEQIDSLREGLRALEPTIEAVVVTPVDFPRIEARTVRALIEAFRRGGAPIVLPTYGGRHGHPTLFTRSVFPELLADPLPHGARSVVHAHAEDLEEVPVEDAGILFDVDTPADLRRLRELEG